jgi:hypothetical protein
MINSGRNKRRRAAHGIGFLPTGALQTCWHTGSLRIMAVKWNKRTVYIDR